MRLVLFFFVLCLLFTSCAKEFVPQRVNEVNQNEVILPTDDPNGRSGEVRATFLSSKHQFAFSESNMSSTTFHVSYVTTAQNFDIFKWVFEGGYPSSGVGSSTTVSGTTIIQGSLDDSESAGDIAVLIEYPEGFGRYDVTHAVANSTDFDVNSKKDFVSYEYIDDLQVRSQNTTLTSGWENPQEGWFSTVTSTSTFASCENSMIGYYQSSPGFEEQPAQLTKGFSNFGTRPKNLVFEYKMDFLILPATNEERKRIALGYTPVLSGSSSFTIEPTELWSDSSLDVTEFRQVIIPLPLIPDFRISFTKYPSELNTQGVERYPFNVCVRNIKIIPANEN